MPRWFDWLSGSGSPPIGVMTINALINTG